MHAIRLHEFGPPDNLRYEEVPDPEPGTGQVRIAVEAAGVHLVDTALRRGETRGPLPLPDLPGIPGREVAGRVDGGDASWLGKRVVVHLGMAIAGYAELAVADVASLHELPDHVEMTEAVAMIGTGRTTMAILEAAALRADDIVLVTAAAGGVGSLFAQAGRKVGATVVGLAGGPSKVERVRQLGADVAVDYRDPAWPKAVCDALDGREPTVSLDGVGGAIGREAFELLGIGSRVVLFGWSAVGGTPTQLTTADLMAKGMTAICDIGPRVMRRPGALRRFEDQSLAALDRGELRPLVQRFPLAEAAAAHAALESRATTGKVVLLP